MALCSTSSAKNSEKTENFPLKVIKKNRLSFQDEFFLIHLEKESHWLILPGPNSRLAFTQRELNRIGKYVSP